MKPDLHVTDADAKIPEGGLVDSGIRRLLSTWNRRDFFEIGVLLRIIALMHIVGFATLIFVIAPHHYRAGAQIFGAGLGATAYLFGLRHTFDADHIAAIDNTTCKLAKVEARHQVVESAE